MSEEVSELIVRAKPEGIDETNQQLGGLEDSAQESADALGAQAEEMEGFAQQFEGAMGAVVGSLAIASTGLLAQVPVIGQAAAGLFSIIDAIAFQMDQVLRPVLGPISDALFDISNAIFQMNGPAGKLVGIIGSLAAGLGLAVGALAPFMGIAGALKTVFGGLATVGGKVVSVFTSLVAGSTTLAGALGGLIGLLGVGILEVTGINDKIQNFGEFIGNLLPGWLRDFGTAFTSQFLGPIAVIGGAIRGFVQGVLEDGLQGGIEGAITGASQVLDVFVEAWRNTLGIGGDIAGIIGNFITTLAVKFADLLGNMAQWGKDLIGDFIDGAVSKTTGAVNTVVGFLNDVAGKFLDLVDAAFDWGVDMLQEFADGIKNKAGDVLNAVENFAGDVRDRFPGSPAETGPLSDLDDTGPGMVDTFASGIEANIGRVENAANGLAGAAANGGSSADFATAPQQTSIIEVDGRKLGRTTQRRQRDITASRNIDG